MERITLGISLRDRITGVEITAKTKVTDIMFKIAKWNCPCPAVNRNWLEKSFLVIFDGY